MTVRELIERPGELPPDATVVVRGCGSAEGEDWEAGAAKLFEDHYWSPRFERSEEMPMWKGGPIRVYRTWMSPDKHPIVRIE